MSLREIEIELARAKADWYEAVALIGDTRRLSPGAKKVLERIDARLSTLQENHALLHKD